MTASDIPAELLAPAPLIANELDEALLLAGTSEAELPELVRRWEIRSLDEAEWAFQKLAALRGRAKEIAEQASVWFSRTERWEADESRRIEPGLVFFTERLEHYGLQQRALDEKNNKTTRLPSGRIETRGSADPKVVVEDEAAVIGWAKDALDEAEYEQVVKTVLSVRVSHLRDEVTVVKQVIEPAEDDGFLDPEPLVTYKVVHSATGTVVPGVSIEWPETTATVKLEN